LSVKIRARWGGESAGTGEKNEKEEMGGGGGPHRVESGAERFEVGFELEGGSNMKIRTARLTSTLWVKREEIAGCSSAAVRVKAKQGNVKGKQQEKKLGKRQYSNEKKKCRGGGSERRKKKKH